MWCVGYSCVRAGQLGQGTVLRAADLQAYSHVGGRTAHDEGNAGLRLVPRPAVPYPCVWARHVARHTLRQSMGGLGGTPVPTAAGGIWSYLVPDAPKSNKMW